MISKDGKDAQGRTLWRATVEFIVASQEENHILTNNLQWVVWSTGKVCNEVHEPVAWKELSDPHVVGDPLDEVGEGGDQLDWTVHVIDKCNWCKKDCQLHFVGPCWVH